MSGYIGNIPVPQATQTREVFTATSGQTTFATVGYPVGFVDVWLNGVKLIAGTDFTATNGSDVVLTVGAATGDTVEVISNSTFEVNSQTFTGGLTVNNDAATVLTVDRATSDGSIVDFKKDGTTVGSIGTAQSTVYLDGTKANASGIFLQNDAIIPRRNQAYDNGNVDLGGSGNRFKDLYLSGGVYLGGTGAANLLDDYEEGTWTPTVSSGSITAVNAATYTKIGNKVSFQVDMALGGTRGAEAFQVGGLPFVNGSSRWTACPMYHGAPISTYQQVMAVVSQGSSYLVFNGMGTNVPANQFSNLYIAIAGTYMTNG